MAVDSAGRKTLRERVRFLELQIMELERRLDAGAFARSSQDDGESLGITLPKLKPLGRPPRIATEELINNRDNLIPFLEVNWPNLEPVFHHGSRIRNEAKRQAWFEKAIAAMPHQEISFGFAKLHLVNPKVVNALCEFVRDSRRYHGDPRSIANAVAGAERITWRRSLDRCEKSPNRDTILAQAIPAYLRRTYKRLYPSLLERPLSKETMRILRASNDDYLWIFKQQDGDADALLNCGKPDYGLLATLGIRMQE